MKKKLLSLLLIAAMTVMMVVPVFAASTGVYDQNNDNSANPAQTEVTLEKETNYTVKLPISLKLTSKAINSGDTVTAYDKAKAQQTPALTAITGQSAESKIWSGGFPIQAKGLIDATHVVKVTPSSFTMTATDGDTASATTKANVTDLSATFVTFKNSLNGGAPDAYELPEEFDATQTATGYVWVDDNDVESATTYTGNMTFTIALESNS